MATPKTNKNIKLCTEILEHEVARIEAELKLLKAKRAGLD